LTLDDKEFEILGTHIKNISKTQIFFICVAYVGVYKFSIMYIDIGGEHKAHVMQVNNKNPNFTKIEIL
jgi:hypothetical protein